MENIRADSMAKIIGWATNACLYIWPNIGKLGLKYTIDRLLEDERNYDIKSAKPTDKGVMNVVSSVNFIRYHYDEFPDAYWASECRLITLQENQTNTQQIDETDLEEEKVSQHELNKRNSYRNTVGQRDVSELIHFTRIENIPSILRYGIIPRDQLDEKGIKAIINDYDRFDGFLDASSVSVSFPNNRMFYSYRNKDSSSLWAVLSLKPELLYDTSIKEFYFFEHNAARSDVSRCSFEEMFGNSKDNETSDVEAEMLVFGVISPKYIRRIYVNSQEAVDYLKRHTSFQDIEINPKYFSYRRKDYL